MQQNKLNADPKPIEQIKIVAQLKKLDPDGDATDAGNNDKSMFVLTTLEKIKETR